MNGEPRFVGEGETAADYRTFGELATHRTAASAGGT
jgi:hypothetical protein